MTEGQAFYEAEIAPALLDLARRCAAAGLSFCAIVEYGAEPNAFGRTHVLQPDAGAAVSIAATAARSGGDVNAVLSELIEIGRRSGHRSPILKQLGVPEIPMPSLAKGSPQ